MELKYILDDYGNFAIFSPVNTHSDMARGMYRKPVSAGFCKIETESIEDKGHRKFRISVYCYGRSVSLGLDSQEGDQKIINDKLNNYE